MNRHFQRAPGATERIFALTDVKLQVSKCRPRARGGVPRSIAASSSAHPSSPRTRGVPSAGTSRTVRDESSPRTRGCSPHRVLGVVPHGVVPAHAGVFRTAPDGTPSLTCRPRARGGVPGIDAAWYAEHMSSPRTRGCSRAVRVEGELRQVVPAHAGVFPRYPRHPQVHRSRPRARGGVPYAGRADEMHAESSPRTRGCSGRSGFERGSRLVVPAHAGVFRACARDGPAHSSRPRARGGVPGMPCTLTSVGLSSPRTRGCSANRLSLKLRQEGRPRARGGVPMQIA